MISSSSSSVIIVQWPLSRGLVKTFHSKSMAMLGEDMHKSMAVSDWYPIFAGDPLFIRYDWEPFIKFSTSPSLVSVFLQPCMVLYALKSPISKYRGR